MPAKGGVKKISRGKRYLSLSTKQLIIIKIEREKGEKKRY